MGDKEEALLVRAETEEKACNWVEAAELYEQVANSFSNEKKTELAAEIYYRLGNAYIEASYSVETAEECKLMLEKSLKNMKNALKNNQLIKNKPGELEAKALVFILKNTKIDSIEDSKKELNQSLGLLLEASELYQKENAIERHVRSLKWVVLTLTLLSLLADDAMELEDIYQKGSEIELKAWNLLKDRINLHDLASIIGSQLVLFTNRTFIIDIPRDLQLEEEKKKLLLKCEKYLRLAEECDDEYVICRVYVVVGRLFHEIAAYRVKDEIKQQFYFNKSIELNEKALDLARKKKDNSLIIMILWNLFISAASSGKVNYLQKRIVSDINEFIKKGTIFKKNFDFYYRASQHAPATYYTTICQWSIFTPAQRISYATKGIEHAQEALRCKMKGPFSLLLYQNITWCYSQLVILSTSKSERIEYIEKMLEHAILADKTAEKYKGSLARSYGYAALYKAHKTLADIAESKEERIKMLSKAIDASKEYNKHRGQSISGNITAQMRLGLLYEEFGILTASDDALIEAKELFLITIEECQERGFLSKAAATFEYLARIEDRQGNNTTSARYYEKAQNTHLESLENVEYKPLKKRITEKSNYAKAWGLIESAKAYHKRENHTKAQESYIKAYKILKNLRSYEYEAIYYSAWASQEEAERLSKLEEHKKAIEQYKITKNVFSEAIKSMDAVLKRSNDRFVLERIEKLEKIADLRIKYCSARLNVEKARILGKKGEHCEAAELFASAATEFRYVCNLFKVERERGELEAVYFLCRAWETMELAEKYEDPGRFAEAANLFLKASKTFSDSKLKLLASGNAAFCQALENGCVFDEEPELKVKTELYSKIRADLRKAATSYQKGGFENGADWALATSTYFDAAWHLIRADKELELEQRKELLKIGSEYLRSSAQLFEKAGNVHKKEEVLDRLNMVEKEEKIMITALNSIKKPDISSSTAGIVAPACSLETSQSPRLGEVVQFTEEERRVMEERSAKKYEISYKDLFQEYPKVQKRECRVAIAQIGVSKTGNVIGEFFQMKPSGLLGIKEEKVESVRAQVRSIVENASEEGINILLFPEMAIDLNYGEVLEEISNLAKLYNMYIIPGSFHDQEKKRNVSLVFGPDGILWEQEKHIPATIHFGKKRFKEAIDVGNIPRKTIVCNTEYGRIAIAICRDFLDMDLRVELKNFEPPVDILLNPAFTPVTADFKAAHFDARRSIYAYCFFANFAEFGDSFIHTPEKERVERTVLPKEEGLIYKDVDLFKLRSERKKWEKEQKKEIRFIQSTR